MLSSATAAERSLQELFSASHDGTIRVADVRHGRSRQVAPLRGAWPGRWPGAPAAGKLASRRRRLNRGPASAVTEHVRAGCESARM